MYGVAGGDNPTDGDLPLTPGGAGIRHDGSVDQGGRFHQLVHGGEDGLDVVQFLVGFRADIAVVVRGVGVGRKGTRDDGLQVGGQFRATEVVGIGVGQGFGEPFAGGVAELDEVVAGDGGGHVFGITGGRMVNC